MFSKERDDEIEGADEGGSEAGSSDEIGQTTKPERAQVSVSELRTFFVPDAS